MEVICWGSCLLYKSLAVWQQQAAADGLQENNRLQTSPMLCPLHVSESCSSSFTADGNRYSALKHTHSPSNKINGGLIVMPSVILDLIFLVFSSRQMWMVLQQIQEITHIHTFFFIFHLMGHRSLRSIFKRG